MTEPFNGHSKKVPLLVSKMNSLRLKSLRICCTSITRFKRSTIGIGNELRKRSEMTTELVVQPRVQEVLVILVALRSLVETKVEIRITRVVIIRVRLRIPLIILLNPPIPANLRTLIARSLIRYRGSSISLES